MFQEADDEVVGWVDQRGDREVDGTDGVDVGEEGCTYFYRPGFFR